MLQIKRETFEERYQKYLNDPKSMDFMRVRLQYMSKEELAYLLAEHDKFHRIQCAEYSSDDDISYTIKTSDADGNIIEKSYGDKESKRIPDPIGRIVDPWGRPI